MMLLVGHQRSTTLITHSLALQALQPSKVALQLYRLVLFGTRSPVTIMMLPLASTMMEILVSIFLEVIFVVTV